MTAAAKVLIEFVNTCPHCAGYERDVREVAASHGEAVELRIYHAGKDVDYLRTYGMVTRGTLFVGGVARYEDPSRTTIERAVAEAVASAAASAGEESGG